MNDTNAHSLNEMLPTNCPISAIPSFGVDQHAEIVRAMIRHEDTITNYRISWFTAVQGLLFAGLFVAYQAKIALIFSVIIGVGVGSCILTSISLIIGTRAKAAITRWWSENSQGYSGPPVVGYYPAHNSVLGHLAPSNLLPYVFIVAWGEIILLLR